MQSAPCVRWLLMPRGQSCCRARRVTGGWGNSVRVFPGCPFFVPFGMEKMYRKYHRVKQKVNFWVISQSPVHKILQDENFCGIIYEMVNTQARGSTPPRSINRSRQHRTDCTVCVFALPDEIRTVQGLAETKPATEVTAHEFLNDARRKRTFSLRFFVSSHQAAGKRQAVKPE